MIPDGQLMPAERIMLHEAILECKPRLAFEVGTWRGGGSTLQIVEALKKNGTGQLVTCEINDEFFREASSYYGQPENAAWCSVVHSQAFPILEALLAGGRTVPNFVFFDGSEYPEDAIRDFKLWDEYADVGSVFMMHDWLTPESKKADLLKPYLEQLKTWEIVELLAPPVSVGLVKAIKRAHTYR